MYYDHYSGINLQRFPSGSCSCKAKDNFSERYYSNPIFQFPQLITPIDVYSNNVSNIGKLPCEIGRGRVLFQCYRFQDTNTGVANHDQEPPRTTAAVAAARSRFGAIEEVVTAGLSEAYEKFSNRIRKGLRNLEISVNDIHVATTRTWGLNVSWISNQDGMKLDRFKIRTLSVDQVEDEVKEVQK